MFIFWPSTLTAAASHTSDRLLSVHDLGRHFVERMVVLLMFAVDWRAPVSKLNYCTIQILHPVPFLESYFGSENSVNVVVVRRF